MRTLALAAFALSVSCAVPAAAEDTEPVQVLLDQARILRIPDKVATIVIGNPSVVDGTLQAGGLLVVTGKSYGSTNIIALDQRGNTLAEHRVTVGAPGQGTVTVWRGVNRETWSCAPRCEHSVMLGDSSDYFDSAMKQVDARNGFATGQGPAAAR